MRPDYESFSKMIEQWALKHGLTDQKVREFLYKMLGEYI